ncbi:helix-turn-helix transcriptional regulator [Cytobacillus spongiae]|jgi:DNA-binding HxlR family transcriptional regulator|uniref:winged helix-turn-helix transcriptional regulator n=1 Tax=Cytobacillus spongiae TaxID=2901381 RepID=UPI001F478365|nr:helix-turn-helix domain-containing protein [Cytobacillus spongiae]UII57732.1 helix-turn-helix transcriptional regulator [Cytobacillus spongiae]
MSELCPKFEKAMQILSKRWTGLIVYRLLSGSLRFSEIEASMPISGRLLSERLKELEEEGIVHRSVYANVVPVRVEYGLTDKGQALEPIMREIQSWAYEWTGTMTCDSPSVKGE